MSFYQLESIYWCESSNRKTLHDKKLRVCSFCGRSAKNAIFKDDAHLIPRLIGNNKLLSDLECDNCNSFFSEYEHHLANFLGINRTIHKVNARKGHVPFVSGDAKITARSEGYKKSDGVVIDIHENGVPFNLTDEGASFTINYLKQKYIPRYVYKAFLKIALSTIPANERHNYKHAFNYVRYGNTATLDSCIIRGYRFPHTLSFKPHIMVFKKKYKILRMFTHIVLFYCQNIIFEIPVPLNNLDLFFYNQAIENIPSPPFSLQIPTHNSFSLQPFYLNMCSEETTSNDVENLKFEIAKKDLEDVVSVNPQTNETKAVENLNDGIVQVIIKNHFI
jgi:hypothetical protein